MTSILTVLQLVVSLLLSIQGNVTIPIAEQQQVIQAASQAVRIAAQSLLQSQPAPSVAPAPGGSPNTPGTPPSSTVNCPNYAACGALPAAPVQSAAPAPPQTSGVPAATSPGTTATAAPVVSITVTSPAGGEQWQISASSMRTISWTAPPSVANVHIVLNFVTKGCSATSTGTSTAVVACGGMAPAPITVASSVPNTGSYAWNIAPGAPTYYFPANVTITVSDTGSSGLSGTSQPFNLVSGN